MAFSYTPVELAGMMQATLQGADSDDMRISFLLTDSRKVTFARSAVFFALKTKKNDGHQFIGDLIQQGVSCFVVSTLPQKKEWLQHACFLLTDNTLNALQQLVAAHRARFNYPITGITGSNGKTIVKEWLSQLLQLRIVKNPRSYNSQTGVPLSVWNMDETHEMGIFEAGISQPGEMEKLEAIIRPQTGIFTNIGPAHDEGFHDTQTKVLEKLLLFKNSRLLVYNSDQSLVDEIILSWARQRSSLTLFTWGEKPDCHLRVVSIQPVEQGSLLELNYRERIYTFQVPFSDKASLENIMHCIALIFAEGLYQPELSARLMKLAPLAMRMEMKQGINNCLIINDAYSSDILSLTIAMDFLNTQSGKRKKVLILSDILQSGLKAEELYGQVAALAHEKHATSLIAIGKEISAHRHCFSGIDASFFENTESFLREFDFSKLGNMGILIKGARDFGFERISNKLQLKDHQTLLEINLDALVHNLNVYRSMLKPTTRIMAMVKAFSYGSGSYEIASLLQFHGVDYLAVAFADEGYDLRNAGISLPVVVLNPELHNLDILFRYKLEPEVYSLGLLRRLVEAIKQFPRHDHNNPFPLHIKLDTGMHRLGFDEEELDQMITILLENPAFRVTSVFSHLAASDQPHLDDFTHTQIQNFERMSLKLESALGYGFFRHLANTAAVNRFPQAHYDMVRLGIGLYGIDGSKEMAEKLLNVTTFKSVISQIRELAPGESVGYNRAGILSRKTMMAIVPVGYADGLNRRLSNGNGFLLVNGKKAPILGNISMDMCCLDITGISAIEGDEVIIFGEHLPVQHLALQLGTIPYEIFTSIPPRVKRIYFSE
jgi:Alr-MurF fusion protein